MPKKKVKSDEVAMDGKPRQRTTKTTGRGSRTAGKLARLFDMPLDIWFEIISHLTPKDLLHLSWTSKQFREMLMSKSHRHLWAAARRNNPGLPDPPPGISEPRYAALLFSSFCFGCGNRGQKHDFGLVTRFCASCWKANVKIGFVFEREYHVPYDDPLFQLLPCARHRSNYRDVQRENGEMDSYMINEFEDVLEQHTSLQHSKDDQALQTFVAERKQHVNTMREFAKSLQEWELSQKNAKRDVENSREESIKQKLAELGYNEADFPAWGWASPSWIKWLALVRQPRELTPRIWNNIRPRLEQLIAEEKVRREERARVRRRNDREYELLTAYKKFLPDAPVEDGPFPGTLDALRLPEVRALLDEDDALVPMTAERLLTALPALQRRAREFKADLVKAAWAHFVERSRPPERGIAYFGDPDDGLDLSPPPREPEVDVKDLKGVPAGMEYGSEDVLSLATALFRCYMCVDIDGVPLPGKGDAVYSVTELAMHVHTTHPRDNRYTRKLQVDSQAARQVLKKLGLPEDSRYDEVSGRIVCGCATFRYPATFAQIVSHVMWETSFYHAVAYCRGSSECIEDEALIHDHDLDSDPSPIRLLAEGETFEKAPLTVDQQALITIWSAVFGDKKVVCEVCDMCTTIRQESDFWLLSPDIDDVLYLPRPPEMEPEELVKHVKTKHARDARVEDAKEARSGPWI